MAFSQVLRWALSKQQRSPASALLASERFTQHELAAKFADVARNVSVSTSAIRGASGELRNAPSFQPWDEATQDAVPDWAAWHRLLQSQWPAMSKADLLKSVVVVADGVGIGPTESRGIGLYANGAGIAEGQTICHVPYSAAVTLQNSPYEAGCEVPSLQALMFEILRHTNAESEVARNAAVANEDEPLPTMSPPKSMSEFYQRAAIATAFQRPPPGKAAANLPMRDYEEGSEGWHLQSGLLRSWHTSLLRKHHPWIDWEELVVAGSIAMSRAHGLDDPYRCGILPLLHNMNHDDSPRAVVTTSSLRVDEQTGVVRNGPAGMLHRALVLSVAATEMGAQLTDDEWQSVLEEPTIDVIAVKPIEAGEEITITYLEAASAAGGSADALTAEAIISTFRDSYGFRPAVTDPAEAKRLIAESQHVAATIARRRMAAVANMAEHLKGV